MVPYTADSYELFLQVCPGVTAQDPKEWRLFLKFEDSDRGTLMEVKGKPYDREMYPVHEAFFEAPDVIQSIHLGTISSRQGAIDVLSEAGNVMPQHPQIWCCYVMLRLERIGMVRDGTYAHFKRSSEVEPGYEDNGRHHANHQLRAPSHDDFGPGY